MCGILFSNLEVKKSEFIKALQQIRHRGPDNDLNFLEIGHNKFGHNRLIILDKSDEATQPFLSEDGRFIMVYNGEIYNYKELAREYNIPMRTNCDTELLLKLYIKIGSKALNKVNGMFAFVIYDSLEDKVFVARDRLGIKPLYYYEGKGGIVVSSEISPILSMTKDSKIDDVALRQYKKMRTFFNGRTIFSNIKMLEAGHYIENKNIKKYWELPLYDKEAPSDEELLYLVNSSIKYRMISDVSVGSYLSGGLDSSIIAKVAIEGAQEDFHTWTVGSKDNNEFEYSQIVANQIKSCHHKIIIDDDEFLSLLKEMIEIKKEPLSVPNEVLIYKMTKEAKKYNTVLLSGEGADELFFGYDRIFSWANNNKWDIKEFSKLYSYGSVEDIEIIEDIVSPFVNKYSKNIDIVASFFQIAHLHGLLRRLDSSSMMANVEARVPFVDHRLVERMAGVPFDKRTSKESPKMMLKKVFEGQLPSEIINRKKVGFPVDVNKIIPDSYGSTGYDKWLNINLEILQNIIN